MEKFESHTYEQINEAIKQASVWCDLAMKVAEPRSSLRTLEFGPSFFEQNGFHVVNHIINARKYKLEQLRKTSDVFLIHQTLWFTSQIQQYLMVYLSQRLMAFSMLMTAHRGIHGWVFSYSVISVTCLAGFQKSLSIS